MATITSYVIKDDFTLLWNFNVTLPVSCGWCSIWALRFHACSCPSYSLVGVNGIQAWVLHHSCQTGRGQEHLKDQGIRSRI